MNLKNQKQKGGGKEDAVEENAVEENAVEENAAEENAAEENDVDDSAKKNEDYNQELAKAQLMMLKDLKEERDSRNSPVWRYLRF
jgi:hypothetical protein